MNRPRRLASTLATLAATLLGSVVAFADEVLEEVSTFDIPDQPLDQALLEFSKQADVQIIMAADTTRDLEAVGIHGPQRNRDALELLLADRGLQYTEHSNRTIAVHQVVAADEGGDSEAGNGRTAGASPKPLMMAQAGAEQNQSRRTETESDKDERKRPLEEIIVTGTNIRGVTNSASPVHSFDREDVNLSGQLTITDFLQTLPQNFPGERTTTANTIPGANPDFNIGGSSPDLRGLGSGSTLILVNGRRIAPGGVGAYVDTSLIPLSAVERIDVLTDGASAIYGADAVGGVINFVLLDNYEGAETSLRSGTFTEGGGNRFQASQLLGTAWTSGSALINYEYLNQTPLDSTNRVFTSDAPLPFTLSPDEERHSLFATMSQQLTSSVNISGTANYASRESEQVSFINALVNSQRFSVEQYGGSLGLEADLGSSWNAELYGLYGNFTADIVAETEGSPPSLFGFSNQLWSVEGQADGPIFKVPAGNVELAVGGGYRNERFKDRLGTTGRPNVIDRDVAYAFGELYLPIVGEQNSLKGIEKLTLSVAGRLEDQGGVGSSADGKFGLVWSPIGSLSFRGTYGTSFRAPTPFESAPGLQISLIINVPDPLSPTGLSLLLNQVGQPGGLRPEEAKIYTVGVDIEPPYLPGFKASLTYFNIEYTDRIDTPNASIFTALGDPTFDPIITRNPSPAFIEEFIAGSDIVADLSGISDPDARNSSIDVILDTQLQNLQSTRTSGLDFNVGYMHDTSIGQFTLTSSGTYLTRQDIRVTRTAPAHDELDTFGNPIDFRLRNSLSWSDQGWNASVFVNYADSYFNDNFDPVEKIDSFTTVDLTISYNTGESARSGLLKNTRFTFSALNVLDEDPPFARDRFGNNINFDALNATSLGRFVSFRITKAW